MKTEIRLIYRLTSGKSNFHDDVASLDIHPMKRWLKGSRVDERAQVKYKNNGVAFFSKLGSARDFDDHVEALVKILKPLKEKLQKLSQTCYSEVSCVINVFGGERPAIHFDRDTIRLFSDLNAHIDIDLYV